MMLNIHSYALKSADTQHKQHGETNNDQDHLRKMFIGGLSAITNEDSLRTFFSKWGEVVDAVVMRDPGTKRSRGFGFITYSAQTMVDKAQASRPHVIDNKTVDTKRALPRPEVSKGEANTSVKKIFVGGLKENHDAQALQDHFSIFGHVVNVKILTDKTTGRKRGFAFVEFDDYDAVDKAVLQKTHIVNGVPVDVKKSNYKQELAKKIAQQQQGGVISNVGALPASYQAYNPPTYAAYPTQIPTAVNPYNGWAGYAQPGATAAGYAQAALTPAYGAYGAQSNGASWNGTAAYGAWAPNGYAAAAGANAVAAATTPAGVAASNGWNPNGAAQNFGDYQQVYNGGPQKAGNLQTNRVNPYNVGAGPSYGI